MLFLITTILALILWRNEARRHCATRTAYRLNEDLLIEAHRLKAQVMHLQVENADPASRGRVGWQVSAFIPQDVLHRLEADSERMHGFVANVATVLVRTALKGIFKLNAAGNCTGIAFDKIGNSTALLGFYEGDPARPHYIADSRPAAIKRITNELELNQKLLGR
jgi:hypothetical protein